MLQASNEKESALTAIKTYLDILELAQRADIHFSTRQICTALRWAKAVEMMSAHHEVLGDALGIEEAPNNASTRLGFGIQKQLPLLQPHLAK